MRARKLNEPIGFLGSSPYNLSYESQVIKKIKEKTESMAVEFNYVFRKRSPCLQLCTLVTYFRGTNFCNFLNERPMRKGFREW